VIKNHFENFPKMKMKVKKKKLVSRRIEL